MENIKEILKDEFKENPDEELLNYFLDFYEKNENFLKEKTKNILINMDFLSASIILAGFTEIIINQNDKKLIISEYLKISDAFSCNSKNINRILDKTDILINKPIET